MFYAASPRNINDNTKRNESPCSYPPIDERSEMIKKMMRKFPKPEFISRMKSIEASRGENDTGRKWANGRRWTAVNINAQRTRSITRVPRNRSYGLQGRGREIGVTNGIIMDKSTTFRILLDRRERAVFFFMDDNIRRMKKRTQEQYLPFLCLWRAFIGKLGHENFEKIGRIS